MIRQTIIVIVVVLWCLCIPAGLYAQQGQAFFAVSDYCPGTTSFNYGNGDPLAVGCVVEALEVVGARDTDPGGDDRVLKTFAIGDDELLWGGIGAGEFTVSVPGPENAQVYLRVWDTATHGAGCANYADTADTYQLSDGLSIPPEYYPPSMNTDDEWCWGATPTPTMFPTSTPTGTPEPTATPENTPTPTPTSPAGQGQAYFVVSADYIGTSFNYGNGDPLAVGCVVEALEVVGARDTDPGGDDRVLKTFAIGDDELLWGGIGAGEFTVSVPGPENAQVYLRVWDTATHGAGCANYADTADTYQLSDGLSIPPEYYPPSMNTDDEWCWGATPTPTMFPTSTPTGTPGPTATPENTPTPTSTPTVPTPTPTTTPPVPTPTPTTTPTVPTPTPTATETPTPRQPVITHIARDSGTGDITIDWKSGCDVDVYYSDGGLGSGFSIAEENVTGSSWTDKGIGTGTHPNKVTERYYKIACAGSENYASDGVGMFRYDLAEGNNLICLPLIPYDNKIDDVFGNQLTEGAAIGSSKGDRIYAQDPEYGDPMAFAYLSSTTNEWEGSLGEASVGQNKGYYIVIYPGHTKTTLYIVGKVPAESVTMPEFVMGNSLVGNVWPVNVELDNSGLKESSANEGMPIGSPKGDRVYSQSSYGESLNFGYLSSDTHGWEGTVTEFKRGYGSWYKIFNDGGQSAFQWSNQKPYANPPY